MATHALARTVPLRQAVPARASACMKQAPKGARGSSGSAGQPLRKKQKVPRLPRSRGTHQKLALRQLQRSQLEADVKLDASTEASMGGGRNGEHARPISGGSYPALVLNADYQPLSYLPLSLWSWQDSIRCAAPPRACARARATPASMLTGAARGVHTPRAGRCAGTL